MSVSKKEIFGMIQLLDTIIQEAKASENEYALELSKIHPKFKESALNLLHYRTFRNHDIRELQRKLATLGLSRLGKAEAHVLASLEMTKSILHSYLEPKQIQFPKGHISFKRGDKLLTANTKSLLGKNPKRRPVRIMVTQPTQAATDYDLISQMVEAGMDMARINCAHDDEAIWKTIIGNLKQVNKQFDKRVKVCMDLGGPKIRTGAIKISPKSMKLKPVRDQFGKVQDPSKVWLVPENANVPKSIQKYVRIPEKWLRILEVNDSLNFIDFRGKKRNLKVHSIQNGIIEAYGFKTCHLTRGTEMFVNKEGELIPTRITKIGSLKKALVLHKGAELVLHKDSDFNANAEKKQLPSKTHCSCTSSEIYKYAKAGERILFDDGKIEGAIIEVTDSEIRIRITRADVKGSLLKEDKGINLPDSELNIPGFTEVDKKHLPFVLENADVVNLSFVNQKEDVGELIQGIEKISEGRKLGIIVKIETRKGFTNLSDILLEAMQVYPVGVMIARGDLAVECGWQNMARIQEEILSLCLASHIPVIWATQVLENLAKKGIPSRAEITDAGMAQRAECVMLNKGPHIVDAIKMLDNILMAMSHYQYKKSPMSPILETGIRQNKH